MNLEKQKKEIIEDIFPLIESIDSLSKQAITYYTFLVEDVISKQSLDEHYIQQLLDGILSFCFNPEALSLYKKLCRYYFQINSIVTAEYIHAYREIWDDEDNEQINR
jgi:hypothetical protein